MLKVNKRNAMAVQGSPFVGKCRERARSNGLEVAANSLSVRVIFTEFRLISRKLPEV